MNKSSIASCITSASVADPYVSTNMESLSSKFVEQLSDNLMLHLLSQCAPLRIANEFPQLACAWIIKKEQQPILLTEHINRPPVRNSFLNFTIKRLHNTCAIFTWIEIFHPK
ncbi:hypothetical protein CEXT_752621 [Caerostris extrusa]|uniref:Uncharacterized protein n=1 Tax=Caerostris extrusa TaxID=172846 RepID=A0AAV4RJT6_CAEEX|nr:hypothetical protein CEXT_752621 [Caerostris extrusa]